MSYVTKTLQPGETVIYQTRLHWIIYSPSIMVFIVGALTFAKSYRVNDPGLATMIGPIGIAIMIFAVILAFRAWMKSITTEMAITNRRVVVKSGFIWRRTIEMERQKVESVFVDQSILGRLLGYGTLTLRGTGSTFEPMFHIDSPLEFRNKLLAG